MNGFTFRIGMKFPETRRLVTQQDQLLLHEDDHQVVWLAAEKGLAESTWVSMFGTSYETEAAALEAADRWRLTFSRSMAALSIGIDFGDRAGGGGISQEFAAHIKETTGRDAYFATHGVMAFPDSDSAIFVRVEATGVARPSDDVYQRALGYAAKSPLSDRERVAFDLFAASQFVAHIPDARLVMLVSALEALIDQQQRDGASMAYISRLVTMTQEDDALEADEREALSNALGNLKRESVRRAGLRLMEPFRDRQYGGMPAPTFFSYCYTMRSDLVHGRERRPSEHDVRVTGANLENLVGHVIAGPDAVEAILRELPTA